MNKKYMITVMSLRTRDDYEIEQEEGMVSFIKMMALEYGKPIVRKKGQLGAAIEGSDWIEVIVLQFTWYLNSKVLDKIIREINKIGGKKKKY